MKQLFFWVLPVFLLSTAFSAALAQDEEYGTVSYFSDDFHGRPTAYGDLYDKGLMTCAHKLHPYGTMLKVTRLDTRKSVTVKVIDKGPYISGRVVELSRRAAELLGIIDDDGRTEVKVEVISRPGQGSAVATRTTTAPKAAPEPAAAPAKAADTRPASYEATQPSTAATTTARSAEPREARTTPAAAPASRAQTQPATDRQSLVGKDFDANEGLYKISLERPGKGDFGVQVGRYTTYDNALRQVAELQAQFFDNILLSIQPAANNQSVYRIILGPFPTEAAAQQYDQSLRRRYRINGFVVGLGDLR